MSKFKKSKAFTLIELLVVIAIIGILVTVAVIALQSARAKARDAKRIANVKQVQTALELFFNDKNRYPTAEEFNSGSLYSTSTNGTTTYMAQMPETINPPDGSCTPDQNGFSYTLVGAGVSYTLSYCLGGPTGSVVSGPHCATPAGVADGVSCAPIDGGGQSENFVVNIGTASYEQTNSQIMQTSDGGYIVAGYSEIDGSSDMYVVKLNADGSLDTNFDSDGTAVIGGPGFQSANAVYQTLDEGYILMGSDSNINNIYVVKLNADGSLDANFDGDGILGVGENGSVGRSMQQTSDGGYIICGYVSTNNYDAYFVKLNADGSLDANFDGDGILGVGDLNSQYCFSVQQTLDGGYIATGQNGTNNGDSLFIKLNADGSLDTNFDGDGIAVVGGSDNEASNFIRRLDGGGYVAVGYTNINDGDSLIIKLNADGSLDTNFDGDGIAVVGGPGAQVGRSIDQAINDGYIFVGTNESVGGGDIYVAKVSSSGGLDVGFGINGVLNIDDGGVYQEGISIKKVLSNGYVVAGFNENSQGGDIYVIKMDSQGNYQ